MLKLGSKIRCMAGVSILVLSSLVFAACGGNTQSSDNGPQKPPLQETQGETVKAAESEAPQITLTETDAPASTSAEAEGTVSTSAEAEESKSAEAESEPAASETETTGAEAAASQETEIQESQDASEEGEEAPTDVHNTKASIKTHPEGTVTYRFQAECTDLRGKGYAPGFSGTASSAADMIVGFPGGACITYLYREGITVNFLVVSDRDVDNAELSFCLGAEWMIVPITPQVFSVRIDRKVSDEDLYDVFNEEHQGALGAWDDFFLNYYTSPTETDRVILDSYECPAGTQIDGTMNSSPDSFGTYKMTSHLSLKEGVNCISMIIEGADFVDEGNHGTMECVAPCLDYMEIKTDAQLGFFGQYDNGFGTEGLSIVG